MPPTLIKCTIPVKNPRETGIKFFQPLFELKANEEEVDKKEEEEEKEEVAMSTYLLCAYQTPVLMVSLHHYQPHFKETGSWRALGWHRLVEG